MRQARLRTRVAATVILLVSALFGRAAIGDPAVGAAEGEVHTAVVGGTPAAAGAYPFYVQVNTYDDRRPAASWFCGGSLVAPQWVLTAAHCVTAEDGRHVTGGSVVVGSTTKGSGLRRLFAGVAVHPGFTNEIPSSTSADVALIRLDAPVPYPAVALRLDGTDALPGSSVRVVGMGLTKAGSPPSQPANGLLTADLTVSNRTQLYIEARAAAGSACGGDSGGPVLQGDQGSWVLVGLVSFGAATCSPSSPIANNYIRTAGVARWIEGVLEQRAAGYAMVSAEGGVFTFGNVGYHGNPRAQIEPILGYVAAIDIAVTPTGDGYWVLDTAGRVFAFGDAPNHGSFEMASGERAVSISPTLGGEGYWVFTSRGRVGAFGHAATLGDLASVALNAPVVDSVITPSGKGYYMVSSDGGIFTFGDARFRGSTGGVKLNREVVGLAPTRSGNGYWLVASDGGVFTFGDAAFRGSTGGMHLNRDVIGMVGYGSGYLLVAGDGGIFTFTDAPFLGSLGGLALRWPVTSVSSI